MCLVRTGLSFSVRGISTGRPFPDGLGITSSGIADDGLSRGELNFTHVVFPDEGHFMVGLCFSV